MARAKRHSHEGAIDDYTTTIHMLDAPPDVIAMSLYNRALVHVAAGDDRKGIDDLNAVLAMNETLANIKTMARRKLARTVSRSRRSDA
jgi:hypothetical protein